MTRAKTSINFNTKSFSSIDEALRALSLSYGGDGDTFRKNQNGRHWFEISLSRLDIKDPQDMGPLLADACGCRVKIRGFTEDGLYLQGFLDADNWNLDRSGAGLPYADGSFDTLAGRAFDPQGYQGPPSPEPAPEPELDPSEFLKSMGLVSDPPSMAPIACFETLALERAEHMASALAPSARAAPRSSPVPEEPEDRLVSALGACGVDIERLALALSRARAAKKED